jgi:hypothetical protein
MELYWGDLHNHCGITYGYGGLQNALEAAQKQLDFCSITPHAMWPDIPAESPETNYLRSYHLAGFDRIRLNWDQVKRVVEAANKDGEFIAFHSFEIHSSQYGDHHIVSPDKALELLYEASPHEAAAKQRCAAIAIPHHIAYTPGYRGIDWASFDEGISPVVEVYSKHGCGLKDDASFPYLHTMGPRDSRNTAYAGLRGGHRFSFVGSTDHHAGFPGSYGDGKLAVLAEGKTRKAIWDAILLGRTYAVTGDKIKCEFTLNGMPFGSRLPNAKSRKLVYRVEGSDALDKLVLYRNLEPIHVVNGEWLRKGGEDRRFKVRLELGWGNEPQAYTWHSLVTVTGGRVLDVETCIRGRSILTPTPAQKEDADINRLLAEVRVADERHVAFDCDTYRNSSPTSPHTSAIVLELEGDENTRLDFVINDRKVSIALGELMLGAVTGQMLDFASPSYRIHRAVPCGEYTVAGEWTEERLEKGDFYHMEVRQRNGCEAYVSPIFMEEA